MPIDPRDRLIVRHGSSSHCYSPPKRHYPPVPQSPHHAEQPLETTIVHHVFSVPCSRRRCALDATSTSQRKPWDSHLPRPSRETRIMPDAVAS